MPVSISRRKYLVSVLRSISSDVAISSCRMPKPVIVSTWRRCSSVGWNGFRPTFGDLIWLSIRPRGLLSSKVLPALDCDITVYRADLDGVADAAGYLSGDDSSARTDERVVHGLAGAAVVLDRPAHALDRLLGAQTSLRLSRHVDVPHRRLSAVTVPMSHRA